MKGYKDYIDLSKGLGILLVVLGHGPLNIFYITVFHMPLFFCIAGLTFIAPRIEDYQIFLDKKINRILVPWIAFSVISGIVEAMVGRIGDGPFNGPLWFLQTLFVAVVIYSIMNICIHNKLILNVLCFFLPFVVYVLQVYLHADAYLPFGIIRAMEATFYIHLGSCIKRLDSITMEPSIALLTITAILFAWGVFFDDTL